MTYGALAKDLGWRVSTLTDALEALMEEDARTGRPFRAVLLDAKMTPGLPAEGFFQKARELGRPVARSLDSVAEERRAVRSILQQSLKNACGNGEDVDQFPS